MSTSVPSPTTELEAVNTLLEAIGESPTNSLSGDNVVDVALARKVLTEISRAVQAMGWHFNTEDEYPLVRDLDGKITLAANVLKVDVSARDYPDIDPVQRGVRLYDKKNHTYVFNSTLYATLVFFLPFDEIPEAARRYITIKAARTFQDRMLGSDELHRFNQEDEALALALLKAAESDTGDYNIMSSYGVADILRR